MFTTTFIKGVLGAILLVAVIAVYVFISYLRDKKIGDGNGGCNGNCASCSMKKEHCGENQNQ